MPTKVIIPLFINFDKTKPVGYLAIMEGTKITMNDVISFEVSDKNELLSVSIVKGKSYCGFLKNRNKVYGRQNWNGTLKIAKTVEGLKKAKPVKITNLKFEPLKLSKKEYQSLTLFQKLKRYLEVFKVKSKYHPSQRVLLEKGICPECGRKLPAPVREEREGGYSELITYCPCGATYTGGI